MAGLDVPSSDSYFRQRRRKKITNRHTHTLSMNYKEISRKNSFDSMEITIHLMEVESSSHSELSSVCIEYRKHHDFAFALWVESSRRKHTSILINDNDRLLIKATKINGHFINLKRITVERGLNHWMSVNFCIYFITKLETLSIQF